MKTLYRTKVTTHFMNLSFVVASLYLYVSRRFAHFIISSGRYHVSMYVTSFNAKHTHKQLNGKKKSPRNKDEILVLCFLGSLLVQMMGKLMIQN